MKTRWVAGFALLAGVAMVAGACTKTESDKPAGKTTLSIAPSEDLSQRALAILNQKCTTCHTAERFEARDFSPEEWNRVVESMVAKGAQLSGDEMDVLRHWRETK